MKVPSKPISSPSRTEKFPPPLVRFLRSNVGSRSRGRSRSSPMFVRKKNAAIETQEPSSPKVTCIGQVRVKRSSKKSGSTGLTRTPARKSHCCCARKTLFYHHFAPKLKLKSFRPVWRKWVLFFRIGHRKNVDGEDLPRNESSRKVNYKVTDAEDDGDENNGDEEAQAKEVKEVFNSSSPPKNALLLTRCRSAPYRSSSLASRFWGSPLTTSETGDDNEEKKALQEQGDREQARPESKIEPGCKDSTPESRIDRENDENLRNSKEFEGLIDGKVRENNILGSSARALILTRSKSEPARIGERLNPEIIFSGNTRLGFAEPCLPHISDLIN